MTDEAKALVERIKGRLLRASINDRAYERPMDWTEADNLIDLIETQAREIERLNAVLSAMNDTDVIARTMAENERLRMFLDVALETLAEEGVCDDDCISCKESRAALAGDSHDQ